MYPRILIDLKKIESNTRLVAGTCKAQDISIMGVTKVFCGMKEIAEAELRGGIEYIADARIENLKNLVDLDAKKVLLRLPMISQVDEVVRYADISLNSQIETIRALNLAAISVKKRHKIVLMIDLGDLREGIHPEEVDEYVSEIIKMENVVLHGIGVNLTCYGGVIPTPENLNQLLEIGKTIEETYNLKLEIISGGNSSSYYLVEKNELPKGINNLRMGEILVLGRETAYGDLVKGMHDDTFIFEAEIIELREKDSIPTGEIGMDAFGNVPSFEDKGRRVRGILAVGAQDIQPSKIIPVDDNLSFLGASSDHMMWDFTETKKEYKVGDIVQFKLEYGALLSLFTSDYVKREFI